MTAIKRFGPWLVWRGIDRTPRPWPRLIYADVVGWVLLVDGMALGIQWRPIRNRP